MKLLHTSDWHLGKMTFGRSRLEDQETFIRGFFLPLCDRERPDAVLLCGDVFDRSVAPAAAIRLFDDFVHELCAQRGIRLFTVTGNHDGAERFALGASLLEKQGFTVVSRVPETLAPVVCGEGINLYMLPWFDPAMARELCPDREIKGFADAYAAVLGRARKPEPGALNLLMCHCFVSGAVSVESESPLYVGGSGEVPTNVFGGFDYVALGHLHSPQALGENCVYSGSPLKYSFDEEKQEKSVVLLETGGGKPACRRIPVEGQRDMRAVTGTMEEILEAAKADPRPDDYIFAKLKGPPVFEPIRKLRGVYPNVLGLEYIDRSQAGDETGREELRRNVRRGIADDAFIFTEFMRQICGELPTDEDMRIFLEACKRGEGA